MNTNNINCNLKSYEVKIDSTNGGNVHGELDAPTESSANSGNYVIAPKDLNVYKTYEFYIQYTSQDDTVLISTKKSLIVLDGTPPPCDSIHDP